MDVSKEIIGEESIKMIQEVKDFLSSLSIEFQINNEEEKTNLITLGNELQKKYKVLDVIRKKEKSVWDDKIKEVQNHFNPVLNKIELVKVAAARAITIWEREQDILRNKKQVEFKKICDEERLKFEKMAISQESKSAFYKEKAKEYKMKAEQTIDIFEKNELLKESLYYDTKASEFENKSKVNFETAQNIIPNIIENDSPKSNKGTRKNINYIIEIIDKTEFIKYCLNNNCLYYLVIDEKKLKLKAKESEGENPPNGIKFRVETEFNFSGR